MSKKWPLDDIDTFQKELNQLVEHSINGNPISQNQLAAMLASGNNIEIDILSALYWYCESIKKGYVHAKWNAGSMLIDGEDGIPKNQELGMRLVEEAAEANNSRACLFIAQCYRYGNYDKPKNAGQSTYWENKAWGYENIKEFDRPLDVFEEYDLKLSPRSVKCLK